MAVLDLRTGQRKTLVRGGSQAEYVDPSAGKGEAGYLIYAAAGTLRAVRFDPVRLEVLGDPVTVVERVMIKPSGAANYAVSRQGTLFYVPGGVSVQASPRSLVWVDRKGHEDPIKAPAARLQSPAHITRRYASRCRHNRSGQQRHLDLGSRAGNAEGLTFAPGIDALPLWTPDGLRIIFMSDRDRPGVSNLYSQAADGSGTVTR